MEEEGEEIKTPNNICFRKQFIQINKVLCCILFQSRQGNVHFSEKQLEDLKIELGRFDLQNGEILSTPATTYFLPHPDLPSLKEITDSQIASVLSPEDKDENKDPSAGSESIGKLLKFENFDLEMKGPLAEKIKSSDSESEHEPCPNPKDEPEKYPEFDFSSIFTKSIDMYLEEIGMSNGRLGGHIRWMWLGWSKNENTILKQNTKLNYKNTSSRHTYIRYLDLPFKLTSPEYIKKISLNESDFPFSSLRVPRQRNRHSHRMCRVQLLTECGTDENPSIGELSVVVWLVYRAMLAEKEIQNKVSRAESNWLLSKNYPTLAIIHDASGKVRVIYAFYSNEKIHIQISPLLDFGWIANLQYRLRKGEIESPGELEVEAKKILDMMNDFVKWIWPMTVEDEDNISLTVIDQIRMYGYVRD